MKSPEKRVRYGMTPEQIRRAPEAPEMIDKPCQRCGRVPRVRMWRLCDSCLNRAVSSWLRLERTRGQRVIGPRTGAPAATTRA